MEVKIIRQTVSIQEQKLTSVTRDAPFARCHSSLSLAAVAKPAVASQRKSRANSREPTCNIRSRECTIAISDYKYIVISEVSKHVQL